MGTCYSVEIARFSNVTNIILVFDRQGTLGGWIGENQLAMAKVCDWFYSDLGSLVTEQEYVEPPGTYTKWTVEQMKEWLRVRGVKAAGTLKKELQAQLSNYFVEGGKAIPPLLADITCDAEGIQRMVRALSAMISRVMSKTVTPQILLETERTIKVFLNCYNEVERSVRGAARKRPGWVASYNFASLLNVVDVMRRFGPLPAFWEGKNQGEGYIQVVKPHLKMGLRKGWQASVLGNILRRKAYSLMLQEQEECGSSDDEEEEDEGLVDRGAYYLYSDRFAAASALAAHTPMAGVQLKDGTIGLLLRSNISPREGELVTLDVDFTETTTSLGLDYFGISARHTDLIWNLNDILRPLLLLPHDRERKHAFIADDWTRMNSAGSFFPPDELRRRQG